MLYVILFSVVVIFEEDKLTLPILFPDALYKSSVIHGPYIVLTSFAVTVGSPTNDGRRKIQIYIQIGKIIPYLIFVITIIVHYCRTTNTGNRSETCRRNVKGSILCRFI
jgi:hypothetical protein